MGEFLNGKGKCRCIYKDGHEQQSFSYNKRDKGFRAMIKETYPKMHVLKSIRTDEDAMTIAEETRNLLEKEKYLKGIFITCGGVREVGKVLKEQEKRILRLFVTKIIRIFCSC